MTQDFEGGENLQDDLNYLRTDTTFHDVTLVCIDGVQMRACRGLLAARCRRLRTKLNPQVGVFPETIEMGNISSRTLEVVLAFIYTETIDVVMSPEICVEAYCASVDLGLSKLRRIITQHLDWKSIQDFSVASSLLNKTVTEFPPSESDAEIYEILFKPFCTPVLAIGQLNGLSKRALELFLERSRAPETQFKTPEYTLLLCVIEWAWAQVERPPSTTERHAALKRLESASGDDKETHDVKVSLAGGLAHGLLQHMMQYIDLILICPHRLKLIAGAVDLFADGSPLYVAGLHHACTNTKCPPGHPSKIRGKSEIRGEPETVSNLQWDRSKIGKDLIVSADGLVVELPGTVGASLYRTVRLGSPSMANLGPCDFDVVFESIGNYSNHPEILLGLITDDFGNFETYVGSQAPVYALYSDGTVTYLYPNTNAKFGKSLHSADVITFHLNMKDRTCSFSINGTFYGVAWRNLPEKVYPAVTLCPQGRYRLRPRS